MKETKRNKKRETPQRYSRYKGNRYKSNYYKGMKKALYANCEPLSIALLFLFLSLSLSISVCLSVSVYPCVTASPPSTSILTTPIIYLMFFPFIQLNELSHLKVTVAALLLV